MLNLLSAICDSGYDTIPVKTLAKPKIADKIKSNQSDPTWDFSSDFPFIDASGADVENILDSLACEYIYFLGYSVEG